MDYLFLKNNKKKWIFYSLKILLIIDIQFPDLKKLYFYFITKINKIINYPIIINQIYI